MLPPNVPDLEHQMCQWTTKGSKGSPTMMLKYYLHTQYKCRFPNKKMSFSPNVPELDIAIPQQIVGRWNSEIWILNIALNQGILAFWNLNIEYSPLIKGCWNIRFTEIWILEHLFAYCYSYHGCPDVIFLFFSLELRSMQNTYCCSHQGCSFWRESYLDMVVIHVR